MRSKTAIWFVCGISYEKTMGDGIQKRVTENYVIDALSFTEAEERIVKEMESYISGGFDVKTCAIAPFKEVFFADGDAADKWYKARLDFISFDEKTEKEKRTKVCYLVNAGTIGEALKNINDVMGGTMIDYVTTSLQETNYWDVFEYKKQTDDGGSEGEA